MTYTTKIGKRSYEFNNQRDMDAARKLYDKREDQYDFEYKMENAGIEFWYDM